jgi:hypothetical protein
VIARRAWTEPRVRLWWLLAAGVLVLTLYVVLTQLASWWSERQLLTRGVEVHAVVVHATDPVSFNDISLPGKRMPPHSTAVLEFEWHGQRHQVSGQMPGHIDRGEPVITGPQDPVTLRVDPDDPDHWTDRTNSPPLTGRQFIGAAVGLPVVAVLTLLAMVRRRAMLDVWRNGPASPALVLGTGQTPVAPRSRAVRCTAADSTDKRVFTVYVPAERAGHVAQGDALWVIHPPAKPQPAYAAAWFERGNPR